MARDCVTIRVRSHKRCFCNGKLAPHGACRGFRQTFGSGGTKRSGSKKKRSNAGKCLPNTARWVKGGGCQCKTRGGGYSFTSKEVCKRRYRKKK